MMQIYNKGFFAIGVILFGLGAYLNLFRNSHGFYMYGLMLLGVYLIIMSFKKPRRRRS